MGQQSGLCYSAALEIYCLILTFFRGIFASEHSHLSGLVHPFFKEIN